ncbi:MAG: hypothetical protein JSR33_05065 [Proteobacteria bacterium]|nr:hypothetical protein [Pseudomonadota bacterium]
MRPTSLTNQTEESEKERPFKCDQCTSCFKKNFSLTRHKKIHQDKVYKCPIKNCEAEKTTDHYLKKHLLMVHKLSHEAADKYLQKYSNTTKPTVPKPKPKPQSNLKQDLKCMHCGTEFMRLSGLNTHLKHRHNENIPPRVKKKPVPGSIMSLPSPSSSSSTGAVPWDQPPVSPQPSGKSSLDWHNPTPTAPFESKQEQSSGSSSGSSTSASTEGTLDLIGYPFLPKPDELKNESQSLNSFLNSHPIQIFYNAAYEDLGKTLNAENIKNSKISVFLGDIATLECLVANRPIKLVPINHTHDMNAIAYSLTDVVPDFFSYFFMAKLCLAKGWMLYIFNNKLEIFLPAKDEIELRTLIAEHKLFVEKNRVQTMINEMKAFTPEQDEVKLASIKKTLKQSGVKSDAMVEEAIQLQTGISKFLNFKPVKIYSMTNGDGYIIYGDKDSIAELKKLRKEYHQIPCIWYKIATFEAQRDHNCPAHLEAYLIQFKVIPLNINIILTDRGFYVSKFFLTIIKSHFKKLLKINTIKLQYDDFVVLEEDLKKYLPPEVKDNPIKKTYYFTDEYKDNREKTIILYSHHLQDYQAFCEQKLRDRPLLQQYPLTLAPISSLGETPSPVEEEWHNVPPLAASQPEDPVDYFLNFEDSIFPLTFGETPEKLPSTDLDITTLELDDRSVSAFSGPAFFSSNRHSQSQVSSSSSSSSSTYASMPTPRLFSPPLPSTRTAYPTSSGHYPPMHQQVQSFGRPSLPGSDTTALNQPQQSQSQSPIRSSLGVGIFNLGTTSLGEERVDSSLKPTGKG